MSDMRHYGYRFIEVPGVPMAWKRTRRNFKNPSVIIKDPKYRAWSDRVQGLWFDRYKGQPLFDGQIELVVGAYFPIPKSTPAWEATLMKAGIVLPTTIPDHDNLLKAPSDALNKLAWRDDSQIVKSCVFKRYCGPYEAPHTLIQIYQMGPPKGLSKKLYEEWWKDGDKK